MPCIERKPRTMKQILSSISLLVVFIFSFDASAQLSGGEKIFTKHADDCLRVMKQAALKMQVQGLDCLQNYY